MKNIEKLEDPIKFITENLEDEILSLIKKLLVLTKENKSLWNLKSTHVYYIFECEISPIKVQIFTINTSSPKLITFKILNMLDVEISRISTEISYTSQHQFLISLYEEILNCQIESTKNQINEALNSI